MNKCDLDSKAFWTAVYRDNPKVVKKLLDSGFDPNETFPLGPKSPYHGLIRPIIAAAQSGSIENIKLLLNKGADITGGNVGMTAIAQAAFFGQSETVAFLKSKGAKHNIFSYTACGDSKQVDKLLNKNTKPESKVDEVGNSVLHYASVRLEDELVKSILKKKVSPSLTNNCKESAVHLISNIRECDYSAQEKVLKRLLKAGATVNEKDWNNVSPLHKAVRARSSVAVKLLVEYGADVNAKDNRGSTPLRRAVTNTGAGNTKGRMEEALEIAEVLLEAGSNPKAKGKDGRSIKDAIRNKKMIALVERYL